MEAKATSVEEPMLPKIQSVCFNHSFVICRLIKWVFSNMHAMCFKRVFGRWGQGSKLIQCQAPQDFVGSVVLNIAGYTGSVAMNDGWMFVLFQPQSDSFFRRYRW